MDDVDDDCGRKTMDQQKYEVDDKSKKIGNYGMMKLVRRDMRSKRKVKGTEPDEHKAGKPKKYANEMAETQKPTRES